MAFNEQQNDLDASFEDAFDRGDQFEVQHGLQDESAQPFATVDNYLDAGDYLNQNLMMSGVTSFDGNLDFQFKNQKDKVAAINLIHSLLQDRQDLQKIREENMASLARLHNDIRDVEQRYKVLQDKYEILEREKWDVELRKRTFESEAKKVQQKLKSQNSSLDKQNTQLRGRDNQFKHDLRKRELNFKKLQERLHGVMGDTARQSKTPGIKFKGGHLDKAEAGISSGDDELLRQTTVRYQEQIHEIVTENTNLRQSLLSLRSELQDALKSQGVLPQEFDKRHPGVPVSPAVKKALRTIDPKQFQMPFDMVRDSIEDGMRAELKLLRKKVAAMTAASSNSIRDLQKEQWKRKIEEQQIIINQQENLIQKSLMEVDENRSDGRPESGYEEIDEQRRILEQQQKSVSSEKGRVNDLASNLEKERLALEREQAEFEAERASWRSKMSNNISQIGWTPVSSSSTYSHYPTPELSPAQRSPRSDAGASVMSENFLHQSGSQHSRSAAHGHGSGGSESSGPDRKTQQDNDVLPRKINFDQSSDQQNESPNSNAGEFEDDDDVEMH